MKKLIHRILEFEKKSKVLEPSRSKRNKYLKQIQKYANTFITSLNTSKIFNDKKPKPGIFSLGDSKKSLKELIQIYSKEVANKGINTASGGYMGFIPGGGLFTSALADFLAAITNEYAGLYYASPGAVMIENEILKWMKNIFGFPESAIGTLVSGGSIANMIALTAARDYHKIKADKIGKSVIYLSPHTHHCIIKSLKIIGLEDLIIRYAALDRFSKIDPGNLKKQIQEDKKNGLHPFLVVATAGTTNTGSVDPLFYIGEIAKENNLWYHIDAAYGGFFILTPEKNDLFRGIELADSLVTDPHKALFIPYGCGAVLIKNKEAIFHSHQYTANYMQDSVREEADFYNPADVSPELTRHFRGLRIWLPLMIHGINPFIACLEEKLLLTIYFRKKLTEKGFKTGPEPDLSISYFWYPSKTVDEDTFNRKLLQLINEDGKVFFTSTIINNKFVIRIAILSFRTKLKTIDESVEIINKARLKLENIL